MIIVKYSGGLGNQIFQYVFGLTKAKELNTDVCFDMSFFKTYKNRPYMMNIFGIKKNESKDIRPIIYWKLRKFIKNDVFFGLNIYRETSFIFEEKSKNIKDETFIEGFFQSVKYLDSDIIKNLEFTAPVSAKTTEIENKMKNENAVSIHIRRGDYVNKPRYKKMFNELTIEHYKSAINIINEKIENPSYYIFSDDPDWVKDNIKLENATYVSHNSGNNSWEDMYLMSKCKHNIIANSSFSYWGAMLNKNKEKIVIAPKKWFNDDSMVNSTKDIYPDSWIKL